MRDDPQTTFQGREDSEIAVLLNRFERPGNKKDRKLKWPDFEAPTNLNLRSLLKVAGITIPVLPETKPRGKPEGYGSKGIIYILNAYPREPENLSPVQAASKIREDLICRKLVVVAGPKAWYVGRRLEKEEGFKNVKFLRVPHPSSEKGLREQFESWEEVGKYIKDQGIKIRRCPKEKT
jgi:hypothetical protein